MGSSGPKTVIATNKLLVSLETLLVKLTRSTVDQILECFEKVKYLQGLACSWNKTTENEDVSRFFIYSKFESDGL